MTQRIANRRRAARVMALVLGTALALPGLGRADHTLCGDAEAGVACPEFDPDFVANSTFAYTDTVSSVFFRTYQDDHESPLVRMNYYVPDGWQFAVDRIRPAAQANGTTPATNCNQIYNDHDGDAASPRILRNAEAVASPVGMGLAYDDDIFGRIRADYGYRDRDPASSSSETRRRRPNVAFLNYDPATQVANFCMYWFNSFDIFDESAFEFVVPVTLQKLPDADPFGWKFSIDLTPIHQNAWLRQGEFTPENLEIISGNVSVMTTSFFLSAITSGTWNQNTVNNPPTSEAIVLSRTPATPGDYVFRGELTTCEDGLNPDLGGDVCNGGADGELTIIRDDPIKITPPPNKAIHDFALITGAGPAALPDVGNPLFGFSFVRSAGGEVPITWTPPLVVPGEKVKGYALALASAGDSQNVHWEYFITDSTHPDFALPTNAKVCGAAGTDASCSFTFQFPLNAGSKLLDRNGTYDVALVTIYADGHRTDKSPSGELLCDNGTGPGGICAPSVPASRVPHPGIGQWEFMLRQDAWPLGYLQTTSLDGVASDVPQLVLLVDYAQKRAQWNQWYVQAPTTTINGASATIIGDNDAGVGAVAFGSAQIGGTAERHQFVGVTEGPQGADGFMVRYDLKGIPSLNAPAGLPSASIFQISTGTII